MYDGLLDSIGSSFTSLIDKGTEIYKVKTESKIAATQLKREALAAERERASMLAPTMSPMGIPVKGDFPMIPAILGIGALGLLGILLMRRK